MPATDHSRFILALRESGTTQSRLAADLLEMHDATGISLDHWDTAQEFVTLALAVINVDDYDLQENGA